MTNATRTHDLNAHSARLSALVDEAQTLMDQICAISTGQGDAIRSGDVEQIVQAVAAREPLIRSIVRVGEEIGAIIDDPGVIDKVSDVDRTDALKRIASIEHAMKRLRERDAEDQRLMESARDRLADQLAGTGAGKSALRAYSSRSSTPNPILQDRQG